MPHPPEPSSRSRPPGAERLRAGAERAHGLDGALAAALERVARIAATSLRVPSAAVVLLGQDRRCFSGGGEAHLWLSRDPGALFRIGLAGRVLDTDQPLALEDARSAGPDTPDSPQSLGIAGFLGTRVSGSSGE